MTLWDLMPGLAERLGAHPSVERIMEWLDGEGSPGMLDRVSSHLARCRRCAVRASEMKRALDALSLLAPPDAPSLWLSEGEESLRRSMAAGGAVEARLPQDVLDALLGRGGRHKAVAVCQEIAARLLGSRALARAAAGAASGEVRS